MLHIKDLNQKINKRHILKSISISFKKGEVTALLGPNGAGKTTLLRTIVGLLPNEKTDITLDDVAIGEWGATKRIESGVVYLPQQTSLFGQMSVIDNLAVVYHYHNYWVKKEWPIFLDEVKTWLSRTGLTCPLEQKASDLSGGQKRKLEVIRTILMRPRIAMFDEPFAGVDPKSIYELKEIFSNMAGQESIAIVISDHNVDQLLSIANKIYVIIDGTVVTHGGIEEILEDNKTKDSYFGTQFYTEISQRFLTKKGADYANKNKLS